MQYTFTPKIDGEEAVLTITRDAPDRAGRAESCREREVDDPGEGAAALLDSLAADGLFDLPDTLGGKFPNHHVEGRAGRWRTSSHPKEMPEKLAKHFRPLLLRVDADFWK